MCIFVRKARCEVPRLPPAVFGGPTNTPFFSKGQVRGAQAASGVFFGPENTPFLSKSQVCGAQAASGGFLGP